MKRAFTLKYGHVILALFVVNALTFSAYTTVWMDEVGYTDPAANLHFGHGFTSSSWPTQSKLEFWAGNVPLHAGLLSLWFDCFGFGLFQTRLFNFTLWSAAVLVICAACQRLKLVSTPSGLCILATFLFLGQGVTFNYRSGRYDTLIVFAVACAFFAFSQQNKSWRYPMLFLSGMLFLPSGTLLGPYSAVMMGLLFAFTGFRYVREMVCVGLGIAMGLAGLYVFYSAHQSWASFVHAIAYTRKEAYTYDENEPYIYRKLAGLLPALIADKSTILLLALFIPLYVFGETTLPAATKRLAQFSLSLAVIFPVFFLALYAYPVYYGWMVYIPLSIAFVAIIERNAHPIIQYYRAIIYALGLVVVSLLGLPMRLAVACDDPSERNYAGVESYVEKSLQKNDVVYADFQAFYALQENQVPAYYWWYLHVMSPQEKQAITCLMIDPAEFGFVSNQIGGHWHQTGESYLNPNRFRQETLNHLLPRYFDQQTTQKYNLATYRRD